MPPRLPARYGMGRIRPLIAPTLAAHWQQSGGDDLSASQSTLTADAGTFIGNGTDDIRYTFTPKDSAGNTRPNQAWTAVVQRVLLSAGSSTVSADPGTIANDGVASSTITAYVVDADAYAAPNVAVTLSATGTGNTLTQPASRTTDGGLATGSIVSTVAATKVASATVNSLLVTDTASVVVSAAPGDLTPVFFSDWATQSGSGDTARGDGGKWDVLGGTGGTVVATTGMGFPGTMANVLRVTWDGDDGWTFVRKTGMAVPGVGDVRYYRWYQRPVWPNGTTDNETHPMQDGFAAPDINWMIKFINQTDYVLMELWSNTGVNAYPTGRYFAWNQSGSSPAIQLSKTETYRFEIAMTRTGTTTFQLAIRVYNSANALVAGGGDFYREDSSTLTLADNPTFTFSNVSNLAGFNAGCNDLGLSSETGYYAYEGGFAICDNQGWIGAYGTVTGEA